jgi:hypothetical protein
MNTAWDIVDIVSSDSEFLVIVRARRRQQSRTSSAMRVAFMVGVLAATVPDVGIVESGTTSVNSPIIDTSSRVFMRPAPPARGRDSAVDFATARTPEQLAETFKCLFQPSAADEADSDYTFN